MSKTLRQVSQEKKIKLLKERVLSADKNVLKEVHVANLIVETLDQEDLDKVSAIVQKLDKVRNKGISSLDAAIDQAEAEINKYTAGGPIAKAWTKMKNLVGVDNPIVKVTTFANAIEKGFSQIPQILKNNRIPVNDIDIKNDTLSQAIVRQFMKKSEAGPPDISTSDIEDTDKANKNPKAKQKIDVVVSQIQKALAPSGIFGAFKKIPYVDTTKLAQELMNVPVETLVNVAKTVNSGTKSAEIATDLKSIISGKGSAETKGTEQQEPSKKTSQTEPTTVTKPTVSTSGTVEPGETPAEPRGGGSAENVSAAKSKVTDLLKQVKNRKLDMDAFTKKLVDAGLDHQKL